MFDGWLQDEALRLSHAGRPFPLPLTCGQAANRGENAMQLNQQVETALKHSTVSPEDMEELNAILTTTTRSLDRRLKKQGLSDGAEAAERLVSMLRDKFVQEEQLLSEEQWAEIAGSIQIAAAAGFDAQVAVQEVHGDIAIRLQMLPGGDPMDIDEAMAALTYLSKSAARKISGGQLSFRSKQEVRAKLETDLYDHLVVQEGVIAQGAWSAAFGAEGPAVMPSPVPSHVPNTSSAPRGLPRFESEAEPAEQDKQVLFKLKRLFPQKDDAALTAAASESAKGGGLEQAIFNILTNEEGAASQMGEVEMDEETTTALFWAVVKVVDRAEEEDEPLSVDVPKLLHRIFDADMRLLLGREKLTTNVTCMQPKLSGADNMNHALSYIFDDSTHKDLPLKEGRRCEDGRCCDACSRNIFPTFATDAETRLETFPELASFTFNELEKVATGTILQFVRLVERVRRTIAHEYGLPLSFILPLQAYSRKYVVGKTQKGGGGGEGDFVILHTDEATHAGYHYSSVLYLSTQGEDFEGGNFVFNDPTKPSTDANGTDKDKGTDKEEQSSLSVAEQMRRHGRKLTPFHPTRGAAVIFSSGWENMHEVEKITSGTRYAVPCFFTTCPVPEAHYEQMVVGKPKTDEDVAEDWLHLLLAHRPETPMEGVGRVKELMMKWHYMCTPLDQHAPPASPA